MVLFVPKYSRRCAFTFFVFTTVLHVLVQPTCETHLAWTNFNDCIVSFFQLLNN